MLENVLIESAYTVSVKLTKNISVCHKNFNMDTMYRGFADSFPQDSLDRKIDFHNPTGLSAMSVTGLQGMHA